MFGKKFVTVLDFKATKIEVTVAERGVNNSVRIIASAASDYAGYINGEFLEEDNLTVAIASAIEDVQKLVGSKIDNVHIGVPAEFCSYVIKNLKANYSSAQVIKQRHIDRLFFDINDDDIDSEFSIISKSPIYYVLDDGVQTNDPLDNLSKNLAVKASFVLVRNTFIDSISNALTSCGIKDYSFVPVVLAIDECLLDEESRQSGAIVIDFGYVSTCVSSIIGDGIVDMKTFAVGQGHILADLSEVLKINFFQVEELIKQIILTLQANPMDQYDVSVDGESNKISAAYVNEIVLARLDSIVDIISKILLNFQYKIDPNRPIYITGDGIANLKGVKNYFTNKLRRKCYILTPSQVEYSKPKYSSKIGLIEFVYASEK